MNVLNNIGISFKMLGAFAVLLAILVGVGIFAIVKISAVNDLSMEMRNRWLPATELLGDIHAYTSQYRITQGTLAYSTEAEEQARSVKALKNAQRAISSAMEEYEPLMVSAEQKQNFASLQKNWQHFSTICEKMVDVLGVDNQAALDIFHGEALDSFYTVEDDILQLIEHTEQGAKTLSLKSDRIYTQSRKLMLIAALASLIVASLLAWLLMRTFVTTISDMSNAVKKLIDGDFNIQIRGTDRGDEIGSLARAVDRFKVMYIDDQERAQADLIKAKETEATINAIGGGLSALANGKLRCRVTEDVTGPLSQLHVDYNGASAKLLRTLQEIMAGFHVIKSGSSEIVHASSDLSSRTEQQARSLADTASTLEEFSQSVQIAADNSKKTSSRLTLARASAENVDETAKRAVEAMRNIAASSKEMNEIISTIDGLAFQTNLLALNAGVEAARAGSAGAGFALVANEVRSLAQRSTEAANSIRDLVSTSDSMISEGVTLVENSGEALQVIVSEVTEVSDLMDEIAQAAARQASGIAEISAMVALMDKSTQQNAAMVEESTACSQNLFNETKRLFHQLSFFDLGEDEAEIRLQLAS